MVLNMSSGNDLCWPINGCFTVLSLISITLTRTPFFNERSITTLWVSDLAFQNCPYISPGNLRNESPDAHRLPDFDAMYSRSGTTQRKISIPLITIITVLYTWRLIRKFHINSTMQTYCKTRYGTNDQNHFFMSLIHQSLHMIRMVL